MDAPLILAAIAAVAAVLAMLLAIPPALVALRDLRRSNAFRPAKPVYPEDVGIDSWTEQALPDGNVSFVYRYTTKDGLNKSVEFVAPARNPSANASTCRKHLEKLLAAGKEPEGRITFNGEGGSWG